MVAKCLIEHAFLENTLSGRVFTDTILSRFRISPGIMLAIDTTPIEC